jgi:hypothetical protein
MRTDCHKPGQLEVRAGRADVARELDSGGGVLDTALLRLAARVDLQPWWCHGRMRERGRISRMHGKLEHPRRHRGTHRAPYLDEDAQRALWPSGRRGGLQLVRKLRAVHRLHDPQVRYARH